MFPGSELGSVYFQHMEMENLGGKEYVTGNQNPMKETQQNERKLQKKN